MLGRLFRRKKGSPPDPFSGLQPLLDSRFRLESSLEANLYLARDSQGEPFEVRFLSGSDEAFRRVRREVSLTRTLSHPALAPIVDIGGDAGNFWLARRAVSDPTLRSLTSSGKAYPVEQVRIWISGMLDGLEALHKRDKLFDNWEDGTVYLGDKGATLAGVGFSLRRWIQSNNFVHVGGSRTDWTVTLSRSREPGKQSYGPQERPVLDGKRCLSTTLRRAPNWVRWTTTPSSTFTRSFTSRHPR